MLMQICDRPKRRQENSPSMPLCDAPQSPIVISPDADRTNPENGSNPSPVPSAFFPHRFLHERPKHQSAGHSGRAGGQREARVPGAISQSLPAIGSQAGRDVIGTKIEHRLFPQH